MNIFRLPKDFLLGTASSSVQIEGGDTNNTWYNWCNLGKITDSSSCITACDHWNRLEEDTQILKRLNVDCYRMSLEWSRIEPSAGRYSKAALEHYRYEIMLLLKNNIKPLITLHHFSEPLWFEAMGGWANPQNAEHFIRYVQFVVENLGDIVCEWVTFNEPNVYSYFGYAFGNFPPGARDIFKTFKVISQLLKTHVRLYSLIHEIRQKRGFKGKTLVGAAIHLRIFDGITTPGRMTAKLVNYFFHRLFMEGTVRGKIKFPLSRDGYKYKKGIYVDFLGVNYYTRNIVEFALDPSLYFHRLVNDKDLRRSDIGWDIYPRGIYDICKKYYNEYKIPIFITENGLSDKSDNKRINFIASHLYCIKKAIDDGIDIQRYYHWTTIDNFEWTYGEIARFGLFECDFKTQKRSARKSAEFYSRICAKKELSKDMIRDFDMH